MSTKKLTSFTLLIILGIIWGTGYSIARFATTNGVPPLGYSFWQSLGPAILITLLSLSRFKWPRRGWRGEEGSHCVSNGIPAATGPATKTLITDSRRAAAVRRWSYYLICGLTGIVIPNTNMYLAAPHLPAGLLAVIVNTVPIIAYPMALLIRVETFNFVRVLAVLSAVGGLMLIVIPSASLPSPHMIPWVLSVLITPLSFAFCAVYIARFRPQNGDSLSLASGTLIASSLLLLPIVLITGNFYALHLPFTAPDWVILLEIVLSSIGYILLFQLIKTAGPVYYSFVDTIVSLTGLFWGYILFQEKLNQWTSTAVLLILIGLILVNKPQKAVVECRTQN